ncbi:putative START domain-containing protein [Arabidopsis thaliana]|uniref:START domain-containing protein n=2 Tax=Arabidopsis thaliana TaxID=3702 RepID=A0A5S9XH11_ARATH|nr:START domain protein [Arabidopsis thaliana]ANM69327.1 START domain protein [Arabidopsis thaliana]CAA0384191.1 unnamed protein product [Arabidopsis thaliana]|eukprot:NP_001331018.1 START domain protein [Arabidopsis thaliana]
MSSDGAEDITIMINSSSAKFAGFQYGSSFLSSFGSGVCERSLTSATVGPNGPFSSSFVRAKMLSSGFLIRPCDGGGSIIHIVDHVDLDVSSVPKVLRPLYESSKILEDSTYWRDSEEFPEFRSIDLGGFGEILVDFKLQKQSSSDLVRFIIKLCDIGVVYDYVFSRHLQKLKSRASLIIWLPLSHDINLKIL